MFLPEEIVTKRGEELKNFSKCIANNYDRFISICEISAIDAGFMEDCCVLVGREVCKQIMRDAVVMLISGTMEVNGKINNWSNGCFGSRWFDMDAKKYGVTHIRGAFYTKYEDKDWNCKKPYKIEIMIEKANNKKNASMGLSVVR